MSVYKRKDRGGRRGTYYASYIDHNTGKRIRFNTHTTDKQDAEAILSARKTKAAKRLEGLTDANTERMVSHAKTSLAKHLDAYVNSLETAGRSRNHIDRTKKRIEEISKAGKFLYLADIESAELEKYAAEMRKEKKSHRTIAAHLQAFKGFTAWLAGEGDRMPHDPLRNVKKPKPADDRRLIRRALSVDEWQELKRLVPDAGESFGMDAADRMLVYETALQTGLRANELRVLTRGRLHLDGHQKYIIVPSRSTKNSKDARQYITADLAERLRHHVSRKTPRAPVFALPHETNLAKMLRADVTFARDKRIEEAEKEGDEELVKERTDSAFLSVVDHEGERLDFHALRHTCGAWLALAGVHPKAIQSIMRHSTITLTLDTYGHLFPSTEADAVDKLARMVHGEKPEAIAAAPSKPAKKPRAVKRKGTA